MILKKISTHVFFALLLIPVSGQGYYDGFALSFEEKALFTAVDPLMLLLLVMITTI